MWEMDYDEDGVFQAYATLGLPVDASSTDIKQKYKELALKVSLIHSMLSAA